MDQVTVIADACLKEAVVNVVFEVHRLPVRRVIVAGPMEVGDAFNIPGQDCGESDGNRIRIHLGQGVVTHMKIPKRVEDALAA